MDYKNLTVIGTSHIAQQSIDEVKKAIDTIKPDFVCLELDKKRFYALLTNSKEHKIRFSEIRNIGVKGFLFSLIGAYVEKKLGNYVGVAPGSEMLAAIESAKKHSSRIALIDRDINITLKRFSSEFSWKERFRLLLDILKAVVLRKKEIDFDLRKVPSAELIVKLLEKVKKRYPGLYRVLVEERNEYMGSKISRIIANNPDKKILAIVGAGHAEEILSIIKNKKVEIVKR
jgi:pheromone shutdown-related protein TraB